MIERIVLATEESMRNIMHVRYFKSERGYQGILFCQLFNQFETLGLLNEDRILEQEYQKTAAHGLSQRPDIVYHIPREHSGADINENNYSVWALKARANKTSAKQDFDKLDEMIYHLKYPLGIFINIDSNKNFLDFYEGANKEYIIAYSVKLENENLDIKKSKFIDGEIEEVTI